MQRFRAQPWRMAAGLGDVAMPVAYADLNVDGGSLVPRDWPGAVVHDPEVAAERAVRMVVDRRIRSVDSVGREMAVHTLCIHGDDPAEPAIARAVRQRLEAGGVAVVPLARHPVAARERSVRRR